VRGLLECWDRPEIGGNTSCPHICVSSNEKVRSMCQRNEETSVVNGQGRPMCLENETVFSVVCWCILVLKIR